MKTFVTSWCRHNSVGVRAMFEEKQNAFLLNHVVIVDVWRFFQVMTHSMRCWIRTIFLYMHFRTDYTFRSRKTMAAAVASPRSHSLSPTRQGSITPLQRGSVSPRIRTMRPRTSAASSEYDARLDEHQQVYVMSPRMMETLQV